MFPVTPRKEAQVKFILGYKYLRVRCVLCGEYHLTRDPGAKTREIGSFCEQCCYREPTIDKEHRVRQADNSRVVRTQAGLC